MVLFLFGAWRSSENINPGLVVLIPDSGAVNSPVALIREFAGKGLGYLNIFSTKW